MVTFNIIGPNAWRNDGVAAAAFTSDTQIPIYFRPLTDALVITDAVVRNDVWGNGRITITTTGYVSISNIQGTFLANQTNGFQVASMGTMCYLI